ncbi:hypothetical protein ACF3DV_19765 [Chlorogloeopsis fritschii PCC 9212]|jgi:hypothetical protein|uniref:Cyanovirin-N domain-containing protein n=1 Tax=Chlorogloeopsis fritschii PCC 6912 TaxID=211165 RepID=A0A3S1A365_CHLFR|nr:hypothetical protein [Chlorogloeopsis fritschii]MBF2007740.1 hypothetical protein [Chlorogloeopsis fritschii C42_A2020_084]RUR84540.1 hypothetical protein PCC6912_14350 [Chlorogloeopsis fritschii PCC 6912]
MSLTRLKSICLVLVLILSFAIALPAQAFTCRNFNNHSICIINIKRSAKYHWEYRADISIDGVKRPTEVYNCRDRLRVRKNGTIVPFESNGAGELICNLIDK